MKYDDLKIPEKTPVYSEYYFEYKSLKKIVKKMHMKTNESKIQKHFYLSFRRSNKRG